MEKGAVIADRFVIEHEAGSGGLGTVYAATDRVTGVRVALKLLHRASTSDKERFNREGRVLAELDHPSVVGYVAHGTTTDGQAYLAMEWLEGENLEERLRREPLTTNESARLVAHVAGALAVLHKRGIVHRDIKPSNVFLVDRDANRIKLLDLGIVRVVRTAATVTRAGSLVGTPGYMAPEQVRGDAVVDARADIFSLGAVLFECIAGRPAFEGENVMALLAKILIADAPRLRTVRPDVPPAIDDLCAWMLAKDPLDRPESIERVLEQLGDLENFDDARPSVRAKAPLALTDSEQRLVCLLLVGDAGLTDADQTSAPTIATEDASATLERARTLMTGVRVERLVDGSLLGMAHREATAAEQAIAAARAALLLRAEMPAAPIAVATGRGDLSNAVPMGEVIDRAARLLKASKAMDGRPVTIDDVTASLVSERFEIEKRGAHQTLVSELHVSRAGARTLLGRNTPFVGREREIEVCRGLLRECIEEPAARAMLVTASAGLGKSRLRHELFARAREHHPQLEVWIGRADPMHVGSPFSLLGRVIADAMGIAPGEPLETRREKIRTRVGKITQAERTAAFIGEVARAPFEGGIELAAARLDPQLMHDQLRTAWLSWLDAETHAHPVALVLEDLHWGDAPTVRFIDDALSTFADRALFVFATARPEVQQLFPGLWSERNVQPLPLRELSKKASETLARHVLGPRSDGELAVRLAQRAAGNPFFLEELVRSVGEHGSAAPLPDTVLAVVESRLDGLDPDARRVLRAASIFGQTFHSGGVAALLGESANPAELEEWLAHLLRRETILERDASSIPGETEHVFRHALVRDAAYAMLTPKDRANGHLLAGRWLESKGATDAALLAEHYERGGDTVRAAAFFLRAAHEGLNGNDPSGALVTAQRGLACSNDPEERAKFHVACAEVHFWREESEACERNSNAAMALVPRGSDTWCEAVRWLVRTASKVANVESALTTVAAVEEAIATSPISVSLVVIAALTSGAMVNLGRYDIAERLFDWSGRSSEILAANPAAAAHVAMDRTRWMLVRGDVGAFRELLTRAYAAFDEVGDRRNACRARVGAAYGASLLGLYAQAVREFREASETANALVMRADFLVAKHNLGLALLRTGDTDAALSVEREALDLAIAHKHPRIEGACRYYLALIHHARGEFAQAEEQARESVRICADIPPSRAEALAALALARLARGDAAAAREPAREAMQILEEVGGIDEGEPFIRLMNAETLRASGSVDDSVTAILGARSHVHARAEKVSDPAARATFLAAWENARILTLAAEWTRA